MANFTGKTVLATRNFYGTLRVSEVVNANPDLTERTLLHGTTRHGSQYPYGRWRDAPTTYYRSKSGIGRTLLGLQRPDLHVGIAGLGVGTVAAYGRPRDTYGSAD